jgi:hypothetical protein
MHLWYNVTMNHQDLKAVRETACSILVGFGLTVAFLCALVFFFSLIQGNLNLAFRGLVVFMAGMLAAIVGDLMNN